MRTEQDNLNYLEHSWDLVRNLIVTKNNETQSEKYTVHESSVLFPSFTFDGPGSKSYHF